MLEELRGRNLAHVGCTLGLLLGLTLGIVVGMVVTLAIHSDAAVTLATLAFFVLTFCFGALGYYVGGRSGRKLDAGETAIGPAEGAPRE
jgi:uncharacterized protein YacL